MPALPATCAVETTGIGPEIALTPLTQLRANFKRGRTLRRLHPRHLVFLTRTLRTRRPGVRISQGAPLLLESDSCSEMNICVFRPFPSIPSNNRLSENFFDGITKPRRLPKFPVTGLERSRSAADASRETNGAVVACWLR